ncbi:MAG: DMT family transporter [Elusimicrobia bacterium]|nr:DMT family transporter [Elusimicrobiota bacterium]
MSRSRGLFFAFASLNASALVFVLGREGLRLVPFWSFLFYWYLFGLFPFAAMARARPETLPWRFRRANLKALGVFFALDTVSALAFFWSLSHLPAAMSSFLSQIGLLFVVLIGVGWLGERYTRAEAAGTLLILAGLALMAYTAQRGQRLGIALSLVASLTWALSHFWMKRLMRDENPWALAHLRNVVYFLISMPGLIWLREWPTVGSSWAWAVLAAGGLIGPFCNMGFRYEAVRALGVSRVSLIVAQNPLLVLLMTPLMGQELPSVRQIIGGIIALSGTIALLMGAPQQSSPAGPATTAST